jgi:endonuclease/exonuclease/phosphatase (EEP) superfamily protein YafD
VPAGGRATTDGRRLGTSDVVRSFAGAASALLSATGLVMLAVHVFRPQRTGPQVFTQIFEPYFLIALVTGAGILALIARRRVSTLMLLALLVAVALRYGPLLISFPAATPVGAQRLHVMTWNMEAGGVSYETMADTIEDARPDLVGLVELVPRVSRAAEADERLNELYPYQALLPRSGVPDLGLLSRFPILEHQFSEDPSMLRAVIVPPDEAPITVLVAHPYLTGIDQISFVPDIQTSSRDAEISAIRDQIDAELAAGHDLLVLGDFNTTDREPAYAELSQGLGDAQRAAGVGLGMTWRPSAIKDLPFGLLRIDYLFSSPRFVALAAGPDCTPRGSDHCLVTATFARPQTPLGSASGTLLGRGPTGAREIFVEALPAWTR